MEKYLKKIKDAKVYILIITIFFIAALIVSSPFKNKEYIYNYDYNTIIDGGRTPQIMKDVVVSQQFIAKSNNLQKIGAMVLMPSISTDSTVNVKIIELDSDKVILDQDVFLGSLKDGEYFVVNIENQKQSKGKRYDFIITGIDGNEFNSVQIPYSSELNQLLINSYVDKQAQDINWVLNSSYGLSLNLVILITWILLYFAALIFIVFLMDDEIRENTIIKFALVLGIFIIVYTSFYHVFDEENHFFRALLISQGDFYDEKIGDNVYGGYIPNNYEKYLGHGLRIDLKRIVLDSSIIGEHFSNDKILIINPYFSSTVPTSHIIPAIGIFVARLLNFGILETIYLGKVCVFGFYIACSYFTLKNMKYYKSVVFVLITAPIAFWLSGTIHLDPIVNGVCFLFTSICLKYYWEREQNNKISLIDLFLIVFCAVFIVTTKYFANIPLLLLFFLIPKNKFKNGKCYTLFIIGSIILGILLMGWQVYLLNEFPYIEDRNGNVNQFEQLIYIKNNLFETLKMYFRELPNYMFINLHEFSFVGIFSAIGKSTGFIFVVSAILEKNKNRNDKKIFKIYLFSIFIIMLIVGLTALYLSYTPVGGTYIQGYQLRYMISYSLLILIPISSIFDVKNNIANYEKNLIFVMFLANLNMILYELVLSL